MQTSNSNAADTTQQEISPEAEAYAEFSEAFTEMVRNGRAVDWDYWAERETFGPKEAAMLANSVDPSRVGSNDQPGTTQGDWDEELRINIQKKADSFAEKNSSWNLESLSTELGANCTPHGMKNAIDKKNQATKRGSIEDRVKPNQTSTNQSAFSKRQRHNILDGAIKKAIEAAGTDTATSVFVALRELTLKGEAPPFTNATKEGLIYFNEENKEASLSMDALRKRIARLKN